jgi:flagellar motor switch protein FliN/FliY
MEDVNNMEPDSMEAQLGSENIATAEAQPAQTATVDVQTASLQPLDASPSKEEKEKKMDMLLDLTLPVSIELGRANVMIRNILDLRRGSIVEFEKLASEPVDILINGKKMAEGEVVVIEKHFGIRITSLVDTAERIKGLGK